MGQLMELGFIRSPGSKQTTESVSWPQAAWVSDLDSTCYPERNRGRATQLLGIRAEVWQEESESQEIRNRGRQRADGEKLRILRPVTSQ